MNKIIMTASVLSLSVMSTLTYAELTTQEKKEIQSLIQLFKNNDTKTISQRVEYPLQREKPLSSIKNSREMQQRFDQVFDASLKKRIASSTLKDWDRVGWRGIMFDAGDVWLRSKGDEPNEPLKIIAVNYSSKAEQRLRQEALAQQKNKLHSSLRDFKEPKMLFKTAQYLVRIDLLNNGKYRYASWKNKKDQSTKPDLVLQNGVLHSEGGSAGNSSITFKSGTYVYDVYRNYMGKSNADVILTVSKGTSEDAPILLNQEGYLTDY